MLLVSIILVGMVVGASVGYFLEEKGATGYFIGMIFGAISTLIICLLVK